MGDIITSIFLLVIAVIVIIFIVIVILASKIKGKSPEEKKERYTEAKSTKLMECEVAGVRHHKGKVKPRDLIELFHDPYNEYDKNAIEVRTLDGKMVGFIPKKKNKQLLKNWGNGDIFAKVQAVYYRHTEVHIEVRKIELSE